MSPNAWRPWRHGISSSLAGDPIRANSRKLRNPDFFDYAQYIEDLDLPLELDARGVVAAMQSLADELHERDLMQDPEHRYKAGHDAALDGGAAGRLRDVESVRRRRISQTR